MSQEQWKKLQEKEKAEKAKRDAAEKTKKEQEAKKQQLDALMGGLNSKGKATGGEGDGKVAGDKGKTTGDPNAKGYYGSGGDGGEPPALAELGRATRAGRRAGGVLRRGGVPASRFESQ